MVYRAAAKAMPQDTILIVDDRRQHLTMLGEVLRECYRLLAANSGAAALAAAARLRRTDLILLDVLMPGMISSQLLAVLRADSALREIPLISATGMDSEEDEERGLVLGADAVGRAVPQAHQPVEFLVFARKIAPHQHERWDGRGYPDVLAGTDIPLAARLMTFADAFDALLSRRVHKTVMAMKKVRQTMAAESVRHFDSGLLACFLAHFDEFCAVAQRFPDDSGVAP
jgi:response regulator RpfG family c-di-GMP phosphodiesterase